MKTVQEKKQKYSLRVTIKLMPLYLLHRVNGQLSSTFDIDAIDQQKQLSLGMKSASFITAIGMAANLLPRYRFELAYGSHLKSWGISVK